ncbi:MAG: flavodoxin family protein [Proteobacteria bacterium]|nr:flavodoxin family protein [Pseudomonadota bacterium]
MKKLIAFYGSPRIGGNSSILLSKFIEGVRDSKKYEVHEIILRELNMSPCLEIYKCKETGRCIINDDFQKIYDLIESAHTVALSSPVMFYAVSAHTKILMDRCQSFWVKKYFLKKEMSEKDGYFFCVGATKGIKLFDGILMSVKYFFDTFNCKLKESILVRGVDEKGEILKHNEYLKMAYELGKKID